MIKKFAMGLNVRYYDPHSIIQIKQGDNAVRIFFVFVVGFIFMTGLQAKSRVLAVNLPEEGHSRLEIRLAYGEFYEANVDHSSFKDAIISDNPNISRVFGIRFFSYTPSMSSFRSLESVVLPVAFSATIEGRDFENINCLSVLDDGYWPFGGFENIRLYACTHEGLFFRESLFVEFTRGVDTVEIRNSVVSVKNEFEEEWDSNDWGAVGWDVASVQVVNSPSFSRIKVATRGVLEMADIRVHHGPLFSALEKYVSGIKQVYSLSFFISSHPNDYLFHDHLDSFTFLVKFSAKLDGRNNYDDIRCGIKFPFYGRNSSMILVNCHHSQFGFDNVIIMQNDERVVEIVSTAFENDGTLLNVIPRYK